MLKVKQRTIFTSFNPENTPGVIALSDKAKEHVLGGGRTATQRLRHRNESARRRRR